MTFAATVVPAKALLFQSLACRLNAHTLARLVRAVSLTEGVTTRDKRHSFRIIHGHSTKGIANIMRRQRWIRVAIGAFWVYVDQTHLNRSERAV